MGLSDAVVEAFAVDGSIARAVQEFSPRAGQLEMAQAVAQTMESGGVLVVEAGSFTPADARVLSLLGKDIPTILVANKIGRAHV